MDNFFGDYLKFFGQIKFGEESSLPISDFERCFKKFFSFKKKIPHGHYKWGEIDNDYSNDFKKSLQDYFK